MSDDKKIDTKIGIVIDKDFALKNNPKITVDLTRPFVIPQQ